MAKAKKQTEAGGSAEGSASAKPAAKKPAAAKKSSKPAGGSPAAAPLIDTSLAAQAAANMVAHRDPFGAAGGETGEKRESSSFKQLKQSLSKPISQGPASFLHSSSPQKKSNLPLGGRKQVGHNQTFGADVNRSGIPRRTGG